VKACLWLNQDPIGERGGINVYRAMFNNLISWTDPLGLDNMYNLPAGENAPPSITVTMPLPGGPVTTSFNGGTGDPFLLMGGMMAGGALTGAGVLALSESWENLRIDGPALRGGRICQLRWGSIPLLRLDYHPIPESQGVPVLHLNIGPGQGPDSIHIPIGWTPPGSGQ
jgi:hypothetical protein